MLPANHNRFLSRRAILAGLPVVRSVSTGTAAASPPKSLPTIRLGTYAVSKLIAGGNPMRGFSHSSAKLSRHMVEYFTPERIAGFLLHCEAEGVNTFQSSYSERVRDGIRLARERGCRVHFICLTSDRHTPLEQVLELKPIAVSHHGAVTDPLFREGKQQRVHDFVKRVHDRGLLAGVSTHNPENLARMEEAGWEVDFYMTCFYYMTRPREELRRMLGGEEVLGEVFVASDRERMTRQIQQVSKPCLAFKILAAGRLSERREDLEGAFRYALEHIKPVDAVIVGMYPVFHDEVAEDAAIVRQILGG